MNTKTTTISESNQVGNLLITVTTITTITVLDEAKTENNVIEEISEPVAAVEKPALTVFARQTKEESKAEMLLFEEKMKQQKARELSLEENAKKKAVEETPTVIPGKKYTEEELLAIFIPIMKTATNEYDEFLGSRYSSYSVLKRALEIKYVLAGETEEHLKNINITNTVEHKIYQFHKLKYEMAKIYDELYTPHLTVASHKKQAAKDLKALKALAESY